MATKVLTAERPMEFQITARRADVDNFIRRGDDLLVRMVNGDEVLKVARQQFESRRMIELLGMMEETIGIRKFQGWEEDQSGWSEAVETLHIVVQSHASAQGFGNVDEFAAVSLISCLEVLAMDTLELCVDYIQSTMDVDWM